MNRCYKLPQVTPVNENEYELFSEAHTCQLQHKKTEPMNSHHTAANFMIVNGENNSQCTGQGLKNGYSHDSKEVEALKNYPVRKSPKQLRSVLLFINFYRRFVQGISEITKPLCDLTKQDAKFIWENTTSRGF